MSEALLEQQLVELKRIAASTDQHTPFTLQSFIFLFIALVCFLILILVSLILLKLWQTEDPEHNGALDAAEHGEGQADDQPLLSQQRVG